MKNARFHVAILVLMCLPLCIPRSIGQFQENFDGFTACPNFCNGVIDDNNCMPGWATSHGTPHPTVGPITTGRNVIAKACWYTPDAAYHSEGYFLSHPFEQGECYRIQFDYLVRLPNGGLLQPTEVVSRLANGLIHNTPSGGGPITQCYDAVQQPAASQTLLQQNTNQVNPLNTWFTFEETFSPSQTFAQIQFFIYALDPTTNIGIGGVDFHMDNLHIDTLDADFEYSCDANANGKGLKFTSFDRGYTHSWDFAGLGNSTSQNPSFEFPDRGTYTICHTVSWDCGSDTHCEDITISAECPIECECLGSGDVTFGVDQTSTTVLSATGVSGLASKDICVNGKLILDDNWTVVGCDFHMGPGASVEVQSGNRFKSVTSDYMPCLGQMYRGIIVKSGAELDLHRCDMTQAHYAVTFEHGSSSPRFRKNNFTANYIGVHTPRGSSGAVNAILDDNKFIGGSLISQYAGQSPGTNGFSYAGCVINNTHGLRIGGSELAENEFTNLQVGVYSRKSTILIMNNYFHDLIDGPASPGGVGVYGHGSFLIHRFNRLDVMNVGTRLMNCHHADEHSTFSAVNKGIWNTGSRGKLLLVNDCAIQASLNGIDIDNCTPFRRLELVNDTIVIQGNTSPLGSVIAGIRIRTSLVDTERTGLIQGNVISLNRETSNGIYLTNVGGLQMLDNNIHVDNSISFGEGFNLTHSYSNLIKDNEVNRSTPNGSLDASGFDIFESGYNTFCCNEAYNMGHSFQFYGDCDGTIFSGNSLTNYQRRGLYLSESIIGEQRLKGNLWCNNPCGSYDAEYQGNQNNIFSSLFFTNLQTAPIRPTVIGLNGTIPQMDFWFYEDNSDNDLTCFFDPDCDDLPGFYPPLLSDGDILFAQGGFLSDDYAEGINYTGQRTLMQKLLLHPDLLGQNSMVDSFYNAHLASDFGKLNDIELQIRQLNFASDSTMSLLKNDMVSSLNQIAQWDSSHIHPGADTAYIDSVIATLISQVNTDWNAYRQLERQHLTSFDSIIDSLIILNGSLGLSPDPLLYEKQVNEVLLNVWKMPVHNISVDSADIAMLQGVADECLLGGSQGVSEARALLGLIQGNDLVYDDALLCNPPTPLVLHSHEESLDNFFSLQPNPTNDALFVSFNLEATTSWEKVSFQVLSADGRLVLSGPWLDQKIDVSKLQEGVYFFILKTSNGLFTASFVKSK